MAPPRVALVMGTFDNADLVEDTLRYHIKLGIDAIFVTDCGSTDGTWEILTSQQWRGVVTAIRRPSVRLSEYDISTEAIRRVAVDLGVQWALLSDPDEFWISPTMDLKADLGREAECGTNFIPVDRCNLTGLRVSARDQVDDYLCYNRLRIARPTTRTQEELQTWALRSPWIFSRVNPKAIVQPAFVTEVLAGDHDVAMSTPKVLPQDPGFALLHVPIRGYEEFERKIRNAKADLAAAPELPPSYAWHWRRWIRLLDEGTLEREYVEQFIAPQDLDPLLRAGVVVEDRSLADFLAASRSREHLSQALPHVPS